MSRLTDMLVRAICSEDVAALERLLTADNVNHCDDDGVTLLGLAVSSHAITSVHWLLAHGANTRVTTLHGTLLHEACMTRVPKRWLTAANALPSVRFHHG